MEPAPALRPRSLTRLCTLSFIDQGVMLPLYILSFAVTAFVQRMDPDGLDAMMRQQYEGLLSPAQLDQLSAYLDLLREHGPAMTAVLALRTLLRAVGTYRMWHLHRDGLHIYISAQLLGLLAPMLVGAALLTRPIGLLVVLLWCYLYWTHRHALVR